MKTEVKFRELPEEKPLFNVGDRPKWTPELIEQLPHGTVIYNWWANKYFTYNGEAVETDRYTNHSIVTRELNYYFSTKGCSEYAEIVSIPNTKEASPEAQEEFVNADPGMQHVEEPKAGDMVETREDDIEVWGPGWIYTGGKTKDGRYVCEGKDQLLMAWKFVRRIDHDRELRSMADEVISESKNKFLIFDSGKKYHLEESVKSMLINMAKKVQTKKNI